MHRRRALAFLALCTILRPARGQQRMRRIGFLAPLSPSTPSSPDLFYDAFVQGMRELGYVEGKNLVIEWRFAHGKFDRLPELAAELGRSPVEVIVTHSTPATKALQQATKTIPIVFAVLVDPVGSGLAASLARPGGNVTGLAVMDVDPTPKRLEFLKTIHPALSRVAILVNPGVSIHVKLVNSAKAAAAAFGASTSGLEARTATDIERAFITMEKDRVNGLIIADDAFFRGHRQQIAQLAMKHRMPAIAPWREYVLAGGLLSYGQNVAESFRRAATYVDRILKGAKPGELPIEQPTKIHLAINRRAADALGLKIPAELAVLADEVI